MKALEIEGDKADQIIECHVEVVDGLKSALETAQSDASKAAELQKKLETAQADLEATKNDGYKEKYEVLKGEFESYKADVTAKETKAAKETAARAYFKSNGIPDSALGIVIRGSGAEIDALELDGDKIKDPSALEALVKGDFAGLVSTTRTEGVQIATPPANVGGKHTMTKDEIMAIKDIDARHKAIAENGELFGI